MKIKKRLDFLIQEQYPNLTRNQIQSFIMQGKAFVDGSVCTKSGTQISVDALVSLAHNEPKYVGRAGWKLEKALDHFSIDPAGFVVLDAGLSTGGFTDCLLQRDAAHVYGIEVGYGQTHEKIRSDARVTVMERTNLRHLDSLPQKVDLVTLDLSFISVLKVMSALIPLMKDAARLVVLIKPQFEADRHEVGKGGIIKDSTVHERVTKHISQEIERFGFVCHGIIESPILGTEGNKEFLAAFTRTASKNSN